MKTTIKIAATAAALALAFSLAACSTPSETTPVPAKSKPAATAPATPKADAPVEAPKPVDPVAVAQKASGLSAADYAAATATAQTFNIKLPKAKFDASVSALEAQYGKPVTIIAYAHCPSGGENPGAMTWGVAGALTGIPPACGTGWAANKDTTVAKVIERAADKGWTSSDYILVFADYS